MLLNCSDFQPKYYLKGQCHEIDHFFDEKIRPRSHINRQKRFRELFHFCEDIRKKHESMYIVHCTVVNNYPDMVSAQSMTTQTQSQRGQRLH